MKVVLLRSHPEHEQLLTTEERTRYQTLRGRRRTDWLAGRAAAKHAFKLHTQTTASTIKNDRQGAPYVSDSQACLSISHSHGTAIAAVADRRVGVDIERIRPHRQALRHYITTANELELIRNEPLTKLWCAKEAVLKALGIGLWQPMTNAQITQVKKSGYVVIHKQSRTRWEVQLHQEHRYCIAIAQEYHDHKPIPINRPEQPALRDAQHQPRPAGTR